MDMRGCNPNSKNIDTKPTIDRALSFHPTISHYRRVHAPNRKYLPTEVNIRDMYKDFYEKMGITSRGFISRKKK